MSRMKMKTKRTPLIVSQIRMPLDLADGCRTLQERLQLPSENAARIMAMVAGLRALGIKV